MKDDLVDAIGERLRRAYAAGTGHERRQGCSARASIKMTRVLHYCSSLRHSLIAQYRMRTNRPKKNATVTPK